MTGRRISGTRPGARRLVRSSEPDTIVVEGRRDEMRDKPRIAPPLSDEARERMLNAQPSAVYHARPDDLRDVRILGPEDAVIDNVISEYREELINEMRRYHGCDGRPGNACRADVYRVDRVILPVVRKMLEDVWEDGRHGNNR